MNFRTLFLACSAASDLASFYLQSLIKQYTPAFSCFWSLHSLITKRFIHAKTFFHPAHWLDACCATLKPQTDKANNTDYIVKMAPVMGWNLLDSKWSVSWKQSNWAREKQLWQEPNSDAWMNWSMHLQNVKSCRALLVCSGKYQFKVVQWRVMGAQVSLVHVGNES